MPTRQKDRLFRREALQQLDDVGELDRLVTVTRRRAWVALAAVAALIIAALVWASIGRLETTIAGQGLLLHGGRTTRVTTVSDGRLTTLHVGIGDTVSAGEPIAVVVPAAQLQSLQQAQVRNAQAREEYTRVSAASSATSTEITAARQALDATRQALDHARAAAAEHTVTSPFTGVVASIQAYPGQYLVPGAPLVTIEAVNEPLTATLYLPIDEGKKVRAGQTVQIVPTNVSVDQYGYLLGTVTFVAVGASTPESMSAVLQNDYLVQQFASAGPVLRVEATLAEDPDTSTGYAWSSSAGPRQKLSAGTLCTARVMLSRAAPITYAFPALGRLFDSAP